MAAMNIPFVDLQGQVQEIRDEVEQGWRRVLDRTAFILGDEVREFEEAFAAFSGVAHCIGVANGTDALELSLRAVGVGPGDEVIVPANTFIASTLAVSRIGAVPVLVDCDLDDYLIDVTKIEERITERTKAILPVHLFGQMAPMAPIVELAQRHGLVVVEDAAQSQGATQQGTGSGAFGTIAGTSFYPGKNLGAYGDAGAIVTKDDDAARRALALRNYGSEVKYHHPVTGFNSRLDTLQAVVLSAKLRRLADWNDRRRAAADRYAELLGRLDDVVLPTTVEGNVHVWHLYVVRLPDRDLRDRAIKELGAAGIGVGIHYPVPIHLQGAYEHLGHGPGDFPATERAADEMLSLPMHPHLTEEQQSFVAEQLSAIVR
jgi:dTDP-4-amino-4,6-dideoxygalactose transaminase